MASSEDRPLLLDVNALMALAWPNHQFHTESPSWHEDVLRERQERLTAGEVGFMDWEQAKAHVRSRAS